MIQKRNQTLKIKREIQKQTLKERYVKKSYYLYNGEKYTSYKDIMKKLNKTYSQVKYLFRKNNIYKTTEYVKEYYY